MLERIQTIELKLRKTTNQVVKRELLRQLKEIEKQLNIHSARYESN